MEQVRELMRNACEEEAIARLLTILKKDPKNDEVYYILGNAYRKLGNMRLAINSYLEAMAINPESPARHAHAMLMKVMNYSNKDILNP